MGGSFSAFQTMCNRLHGNDPDVLVVNTDTFPYFDPDAARQLGVSLQNNTRVQRLLIDISNLSVLGPDDGVTKIASFIKNSRSLKAVLLKSPGLASMEVYICPNQRVNVANVATAFLAALTESESVDEVVLVDIDLVLPVKAFHTFLTNCKSNLTRLRMSYGRELEPSQMTTIMDGFAQNVTLKGLELTEVPESMWSACLAGIAMNEHLHSLNLDRLSEEYEHSPLNNVIETNTSIRSLSITQSRFVSIDSLTTSLQRNDTIVELILCNCGIGGQDPVHLKRMMKECPNIARLNLSGNSLRVRGLQQLAEGLYRNQTLSLLDISDNEFEGDEAARTLGNLFRRNRTLARIDADRNNWSTPAGIRSCAEGLARSSKVTTLDMSQCRLNGQTMAILADFGLRHNRSLQVLALNTNYVNAEGLQALLRALEESGTVTSLSLNGNSLDPSGGAALARALSSPTFSLKRLAINNNGLGNDGVLAIAEALHTNIKLECLGFEENPFGKEAMDGLCRALRVNSSLKQICFTFPNTSWLPQWYAALEVNQGLTHVKTPGVVAENSLVEAKLDFYAWRNVCRPIVMKSPSLMDGVWPRVLYSLSQKSKRSTIYHILRTQLPSRVREVRWGGRKRSAAASTGASLLHRNPYAKPFL